MRTAWEGNRLQRALINLALALGVGVGAGTGVHAGEPDRETYLVLYSPGPNWNHGRPVREQGLEPHFRWLLNQYSSGAMKLAGPFTDGSGAMMVLEAADLPAAESLMSDDPAIEGRIMSYELRPLRLQPWKSILLERERRMLERSNRGARR